MLKKLSHIIIISMVLALCVIPSRIKADTIINYDGLPYQFIHYDTKGANRGYSAEYKSFNQTIGVNFGYVNAPLNATGYYFKSNYPLAPGTYNIHFDFGYGLTPLRDLSMQLMYTDGSYYKTAILNYRVVTGYDGSEHIVGDATIYIEHDNVSRFIYRLYPKAQATSSLVVHCTVYDMYLTAPSPGDMAISNSINGLADKIEEIDDNINNKLDDLFTSDGVTSSNANNSNIDLEDKVSQYDDIEGNLVSDMNTNIDSIDTNLDILQQNDFIKSAQFISTNLDRIYNSNVFISYLIDFGLILGLVLTIIGISVKRK